MVEQCRLLCPSPQQLPPATVPDPSHAVELTRPHCCLPLRFSHQAMQGLLRRRQAWSDGAGRVAEEVGRLAEAAVQLEYSRAGKLWGEWRLGGERRGGDDVSVRALVPAESSCEGSCVVEACLLKQSSNRGVFACATRPCRQPQSSKHLVVGQHPTMHQAADSRKEQPLSPCMPAWSHRCSTDVSMLTTNQQ
jgi:hypothetical protein